MKALLRPSALLILLFASLHISALNITVIGIGRLGLCLALCLEKAGHSVLGVDLSREYIDSINNKTLQSDEPFVEKLLKQSSQLRATTSLEEGLIFSDICFITIATTLGTDAYNFLPLTELFSNINSYEISNKHIVLSSTVTPGYIKYTALPALNNCDNVTISYNPPFIAQGEIVQILTNPDMVLIGTASDEAAQLLRGVYEGICVNQPYYAIMSSESAEITKLAVNCFITSKIAYANFIGDIADGTLGADKQDILKAVGSDRRIGSQCLRPGYGFGGPCFPRDNRGLGNYASKVGIIPLLSQATDNLNRAHTVLMAQKLIAQNRTEYLFQDVSYKPNSPVKILNESQKLEVAKLVAQSGKRVIIRDTKAVIQQLKREHGNLFCYEVL